MNPATKKPTIFISSTIYDFRDLRSALKYYLEELGYVVNMSEFNDFQREAETNSYEACLNTVKESDYYILLIGSRTGGPYTMNSGTSITQEEYRTAYESAKAGKTRIFAFVRSEIWTIKEDRKELVRLLQDEFVKTGELPAETAEKIVKHPSKFATDAERIFTFVDEVCRAQEMKAAIKGNAPFPQANWVHQFNTFRDIVDCLRVQLKVGEDLENKKTRENLKSELLGNLAAMCTKTKQYGIHPRTQFTRSFRDTYKLAFGKTLTAKRKYVRWMIMGSVSLTLPPPSLRSSSLERCMDLGIFLSHDNLTGHVSKSDVHQSLETLRIAIDRYLACQASGEFMMLSKKYGNLIHGENDDLVTIECDDFATVVHTANKLDDVLLLTEGLVRFLNGEDVDLQKIPSQPLSPYDGMSQELVEETVSVAEVIEHLRTSSL